MLLIGLTGSIATGKSTCSSILRSPPYSLPIIDADVLARKAVEPGSWGYKRIVKTFGASTPDLLLPASDPLSQGREDGPDGLGRPLNRPALGRRVFGTTDERVADRKKLNAIIHPIVRFYMARSLLWYYLTGCRAVVLDIPLLFESGLDAFCSAVLVVAVSDPKIQMRRLMDRDAHLTEEDAKNRVASQVDVREKAKRAEARNGENGKRPGRGYVVYNDGSKDDLKLQIDEVMNQIRSSSPQWWGWMLLLFPPLMVSVAGLEVLRSIAAKKRWEREKGKELAKPKL